MGPLRPPICPRLPHLIPLSSCDHFWGHQIIISRSMAGRMARRQCFSLAGGQGLLGIPVHIWTAADKLHARRCREELCGRLWSQSTQHAFPQMVVYCPPAVISVLSYLQALPSIALADTRDTVPNVTIGAFQLSSLYHSKP